MEEAPGRSRAAPAVSLPLAVLLVGFVSALLLLTVWPNALLTGVFLAATAVDLVLLVLQVRGSIPRAAATFPDPGHYEASVRRQMIWSGAGFLGVVVVGSVLELLFVGTVGGWAELLLPACLLVFLAFTIRASFRLRQAELARAAPPRLS
jgi:hypothetical protein